MAASSYEAFRLTAQFEHDVAKSRAGHTKGDTFSHWDGLAAQWKRVLDIAEAYRTDEVFASRVDAALRKHKSRESEADR